MLADGPENTGGRAPRAILGTNVEGANAHNRRVILDAIRVNRAMSRADLARATKLSKQAVSNIVDELEREGVIMAQDTVAREVPGRPAVPYVLAPNGAYAIGLHIDRHEARAVIVDLCGDVLVRQRARLHAEDPDQGFKDLLNLLSSTRKDAAALRPDLEARLVGLGVAMPGPFGIDEARSVTADVYSMARWQSFPLVSRLESETGLVVSLRNDAAAATMAEMIAGRLHGVRDAVCLYLGYGLGAGIVINGELYNGRNGNAGDVGLIPAQPGCEPRPLLERLATLAALSESLDLDPADPEFSTVITQIAEKSGPEYQAWLSQAAREIGWLLAMTELVFAPEAIVLCGSAPEALLDDLLERLKAPGLTGDRPRMMRGLADIWAPARGAASEPIGRSFSPRYSALFKK
ncbi:ROK family transcriptional regulator (plasmid) [Rhizobium sp. WYJ-E13]|nr:ROK family transcriptional regulator [Rhizobium sp. WYJ-E13]